MATKEIAWNEGGGSMTVEYPGTGSGPAIFSSVTNEGTDRIRDVSFVGGGLAVVRTVRQAGMREVFEVAEGGFALRDGSTFNVLKNK